MNTKQSTYTIIILAITVGAVTGAACMTVILGADLCAGSTENCFREWVGALSGWAAAFAACVTIYFLWNQAVHLQKQTEFLLGDAPAELSFMPGTCQSAKDDEEFWIVTFKIKVNNFNKNSIKIKSISFDITHIEECIIRYFTLIKSFKPNIINEEIELANTVYGWEDRGKPNRNIVYSIDLKIRRPNTNASQISIAGKLAIEIQGARSNLIRTKFGGMVPISPNPIV